MFCDDLRFFCDYQQNSTNSQPILIVLTFLNISRLRINVTRSSAQKYEPQAEHSMKTSLWIGTFIHIGSIQTDNPTNSTHPSGRKTHYGAKKSCQHPITNRPIHGQYLVGKVFESITTVFLSLHRCRIQKKSSQSVVWLLNLINLRRWSQKGEPTS